jgi:hypothetical protein
MDRDGRNKVDLTKEANLGSERNTSRNRQQSVAGSDTDAATQPQEEKRL